MPNLIASSPLGRKRAVPFRATSETNALGATRHFAYNSAGEFSHYQDRNGQVRQYDYDSSGNVTSETWYSTAEDAPAADSSPLPPGEGQGEGEAINVILHEYDSAGRITSESDNNTSDTYTYNNAGQITSTTQSTVGGPTVTLNYQYDSAGRRTQMAAFVDSSCDFVDDYVYDSLGRVVSVTEHGVDGGNAVAAKEVAFTYNAANQVVSIDRYQNGQLAVEGDYSYDSLGRLTGLVYHQGDIPLNSYAWTYSDSGQWSVVSGQSSLSTLHSLLSTSWSPSGGLMPVHDTTGIVSALSSGGLAGLDLLTSMTSIDGTANYSYDPTGQLIGASYSGAQDDESYSYDANGNRTLANGSVYVTGADNRLLSDGTYTYSYDAEGNRTAKFIDADHDGLLDAGDTAVTQYGWDNRNRLVEVTDRAIFGGDPTQAVDYLYDAENRWVGEDIRSPLPPGEGQGEGGTERQIRFAYDGNQIVLQFEKSGGGAVTGENLSHRYLWQPNAVDQLLTDEQVTTTSQPGRVVLPLTDHLGTIRDLALHDTEQDLTAIAVHRMYNAFGDLVSQTNAAVDFLFGFTGRPRDPATGLQNNLNRWYASVSGRWLSDDPIGFRGGDTDASRYVGNRPADAIDPNGLVKTPKERLGELQNELKNTKNKEIRQEIIDEMNEVEKELRRSKPGGAEAEADQAKAIRRAAHADPEDAARTSERAKLPDHYRFDRTQQDAARAAESEGKALEGAKRAGEAGVQAGKTSKASGGRGGAAQLETLGGIAIVIDFVGNAINSAVMRAVVRTVHDPKSSPQVALACVAFLRERLNDTPGLWYAMTNLHRRDEADKERAEANKKLDELQRYWENRALPVVGSAAPVPRSPAPPRRKETTH